MSNKLNTEYRRLLSEENDEGAPNILQMETVEGSVSEIKRWYTRYTIDKFLSQMYAYYKGKGYQVIILSKVTNLMIVAFVVLFSIFLVGCIDYDSLMTTHQLFSSINFSLIWEMHWFFSFSLSVFFVVWTVHLVSHILEIGSLKNIRAFYAQVLQIPEEDLATTEWEAIVANFLVYHRNNSDFHLDEYNIANRILRSQNYLIGLFNQKILKKDMKIFGILKVPLPLTKSLEWNINLAVLNFFLNESGLREKFLRKENRKEFANELRRQILLFGILTMAFSPFLALYLCTHFFFKYGEEFYRNPSSIGSRQYSRLARVLFREYNEYPHLFERRIKQSNEFAQKYIDQFPSEKTAIFARFICFISGSFAIVLLVATVFSESFVDLEITPNHSVIFYLGIFSAIFAVSRSFIPEETLVFHPDSLMSDITALTRYYPDSWRGGFHSIIRREFSQLYQYRIVLFLLEMAGIMITPFAMIFSISHNSLELVDFFRDYSVKIDEDMGYVCSFASFDFNRFGDKKYGAQTEEGHTSYGKMEKSFISFSMNNPKWVPKEDGQNYLEKVTQLQKSTMSQSGHSENIYSSGVLLNDDGQDVGTSNMLASRENRIKHINLAGLTKMVDKLFESNMMSSS